MTELQYGQQPEQSFTVCSGSKTSLHIGLRHFITVRQLGAWYIHNQAILDQKITFTWTCTWEILALVFQDFCTSLSLLKRARNDNKAVWIPEKWPCGYSASLLHHHASLLSHKPSRILFPGTLTVAYGLWIWPGSFKQNWELLERVCVHAFNNTLS